MTAHAGLMNISTGFAEIQRTPDTFKTATIATGAGAHTLWTPATGKRFRLLGYDCTISTDATLAAAAFAALTLQETGGLFIHRDGLWLPSVSAPTPGSIKVTFYPGGNGYLSTAPGNVLSILFGTAFVLGTVVANAWGCEE